MTFLGTSQDAHIRLQEAVNTWPDVLHARGTPEAQALLAWTRHAAAVLVEHSPFTTELGEARRVTGCGECSYYGEGRAFDFVEYPCEEVEAVREVLRAGGRL